MFKDGAVTASSKFFANVAKGFVFTFVTGDDQWFPIRRVWGRTSQEISPVL